MSGYFTRTYEHWREVETPDGAGGVSVEWNKIDDIPGRASPTRRTDSLHAMQLQSEIAWMFATDPDVDLKIGDEIRFDGHKLKVKAAAPTSTGRRLEATCEETL